MISVNGFIYNMKAIKIYKYIGTVFTLENGACRSEVNS